MLWIVPPPRQIFLINQTVLDSFKLLNTGVIKCKMNNHRFVPYNGLPMLNYSNFFGDNNHSLRRSFSEGNFHSNTFSKSWWNHPQVLYNQRYFNVAQQPAVGCALPDIPGVSTKTENPKVAPQKSRKTQTAVSTKSIASGSEEPYIEEPPKNPEAPEFTYAFPVCLYKFIRESRFEDYDSQGSSESEDFPEVVTEAMRRFVHGRFYCDVPISPKTYFKKCFKFHVMSYNVLAQDLLNQHPYLYYKHNRQALSWRARWEKIYREISNMQPTIVCLQEVQESHLKEYFMQQLKLVGYEGIYKKRTGVRGDGCAIFYQVERVTLLEHQAVEFLQPKAPVLNRDNVALIAIFCPKDLPDNRFLVATTHLLYNPKRQDVRLAQTQLLLAEIERMSFYLDSKDQKKYLPIILTGDFNSTPTSSVFKFISEGHLEYKNLAAKRLDKKEEPSQGCVILPWELQISDKSQHAALVEYRDGYYEQLQSRPKDRDPEHYKYYLLNRYRQLELTEIHYPGRENRYPRQSFEPIKSKDLFSTGTLSHVFAFKSAYPLGDPSNPTGTTFQNEWVTVDYIFYSGKKVNGQFKEENLKLSSFYRMLHRSELKGLRIPNDFIGSDHMCLVARFVLNTDLEV